MFDVARERWDVAAGAEPVGGEVRLLLSLRPRRIVAEATAAVPSPIAAALRSVFEALQLLAADGSVADAVEQLVHDPAALVAARAGRRRRAGRSWPAAPGRSSAPVPPAAGDEPGRRPRVGADTVTVVADLAARSLTIDAPARRAASAGRPTLALTPGQQPLVGAARHGRRRLTAPAAAWL